MVERERQVKCTSKVKKERQVSCTGEVIENVMRVVYRRGDGGGGDEYKDEDEKET